MAYKPIITEQIKPQKPKLFKNIGLRENSFYFQHWAIYAVVVFVALIFIKALFNGFANLDDDTYLFNNPYIKNFNFESVKAIFTSFFFFNYHPLTTLTYLFEYHLYGLNPFPYHFLNVLLHLINTLLVYKLSEKLSGNWRTALLVSILFAIHPMHVESVAWVSERKDLLYTLFYLSALLFYLEYLKTGFKNKFYWFCIIFYFLSLLSKSAAVSFPIIILAVDVYKNRELNIKMLLEKLPFIILSLLFGISAIMSQHNAIKEIDVQFSFVDRMFLFTYSIAFYIIKLVAPFSLSAIHFYPVTHGSALPWQYYASLPFVLILIWLIIRRTSLRREKLFGALFFLITIFLMLQIIPFGNAFAAERYTYLSYFGLFYIVVQWVSGIQKKILKKTFLIIAALFLIMFSYLSWERTGVWKNGIVLFTDVINKYPDNYQGYYFRGNVKKNQKDFTGALQDYNKNLHLFPNCTRCLFCRGQIYNEFKDYRSALYDFNLFVQLDSASANEYVYNYRGMAYEGIGENKSAMNDYNKAININKEFQIAYNNRGILKLKMDDVFGAFNDINKAISIDTAFADAYNNRANIKAMLGDYAGSVEDYNYSINFDKGNNMVYFNRALSKLDLKDTTGACEDWNKAMQYGNKDAEKFIKLFCK